jgi:putative heme-binding domain-containing protein
MWRVEALRPKLVQLATSNGRGAPEAIGALAVLGGADSQAILKSLAGAGQPFATRRAAAQGMLTLDPVAGTRLAMEVLSAAGPSDDPQALWTSLWQNKTAPESLPDALRDVKLPTDVAKLGIRSARISGRELSGPIAAISAAGGLNAPPTEIPRQELDRLVKLVRETGNPQRGEVVFRRAETLCLRCHAISGAGGQVGPDLTSLGASAQIDYLIESILLPNKAVKENYHSLVIETKSGKVLNGVKIRENASELVLRNAEDVELSIPVADIEERVNGGSIMPAGLTDTLTEQELIDLVRFLSELGKVGPYAPSQARVARRWQALDPGTPRLAEILISEPASVPTREDLAWTPVYADVSGSLPLTDLPVVVYPIGGVRTHILRTEVEVTTPGKLGLKTPDATGVSVWIDGRPLPAQPDMSAELSRGRHTILLRVELALRTQPVRLELVDLPGSEAVGRFVTGK